MCVCMCRKIVHLSFAHLDKNFKDPTNGKNHQATRRLKKKLKAFKPKYWLIDKSQT